MSHHPSFVVEPGQTYVKNNEPPERWGIESDDGTVLVLVKQTDAGQTRVEDRIDRASFREQCLGGIWTRDAGGAEAPTP